ncbi:MAG: DUF5320 domain-containing protein [bacterium]
MPRGDKRGPEGFGPMTGRALGYCAGNDRPGFAVDAAPQGRQRGFRGGARRAGRGMGYGRGYSFRNAGMNAPIYEEARPEESSTQAGAQNQVDRLENLANSLQNELEKIKTEINELKNDK